MSILTRISRLFKADIHGVLDNLEQPEIILKQAIRDMQTEIDKGLSLISALKRQQEQLQRRRQTLSQQIEDLQQQLQFCLSENNEALAKSVIRKKLQAESLSAETARQLQNLAEERNLKTTEVEERLEKLQSIRDKLALFSETNESEDVIESTETPCPVSKDDIELAYLYEKQRYAEAPANGEQS